MKRTLAITLAAVFVASALASCAGTPDAAANATGANIRVTSSDAADAAAWLDARLGDKLTDRVVLGTDADGYGIDLTALQNDGYVIRSLGGEVALFARTADGLDRAARKYAKAVEAGTAVTDETYHEGYRVKSLTIAGNDVSEYAIVRVTEDDPCVTTAATELAEYIEKTCGAALPVCTDPEFASSGKAHKITISSGDTSLGDEGFTLAIGEDGNLAITGGVWRGSRYGVYALLVDIGWRFLASGGYYYEFMPADRQEYLYEADCVDLTAAINRTEIPSIPIRGGVGGEKQRNTYYGGGNAAYGGYGYTVRACHGLQNNHKTVFSGEYEGLCDPEGDNMQPCFTNEDILEAIDSYALGYVKKRLDAGQQIGREIVAVDVAQWDNFPFCECKSCQKVFKEEGCHTGALLRMVNRVAALLDDNYPGVYASFLVYTDASKLPAVTRPAHNVYCAFCFYCGGYFTCSNHCISGGECSSSKPESTTNVIPAKQFEEWSAVVDPHNIQVWYYPFNCFNVSYNAPIYTNLLADMKYLASYGAEHVYLCFGDQRESNGLINESLSRYLCSKFAWDATLTEDDARALIHEWFSLVYGEAGDILYDLTIMSEYAGDLAGCWCSFFYGDRVDFSYISKHADYIWEACERAIEMAGDSAEEALIGKYCAGFMYMSVVSRYQDMYVNGSAEEKALITEKYRLLWELFSKHHLARLTNMETFWYVEKDFQPDVDPYRWGVEADLDV